MDQIQHFRGLDESIQEYPNIIKRDDIKNLDENGYCIIENFVDENILILLISEIIAEYKSQIKKWRIPATSPEYGQVR